MKPPYIKSITSSVGPKLSLIDGETTKTIPPKIHVKVVVDYTDLLSHLKQTTPPEEEA